MGHVHRVPFYLFIVHKIFRYVQTWTEICSEQKMMNTFMFRYFWWGMCIVLFSICLLFIRFSDVFKHEQKYVQNKKWWTRSCLDIFDGACASCCFLTLVAHLMFIHLWIASYSWPKEAKCRGNGKNFYFCMWAPVFFFILSLCGYKNSFTNYKFNLN